MRRVGLEDVGVDADERDVLAGVLDRRDRALVDRATDRQDARRRPGRQDLRGGLVAASFGLEATGEGAVCLPSQPTTSTSLPFSLL